MTADDLEALFRHAPAAMMLLRGPALVVERANVAATALLGHRDSILGRPLAGTVDELAPMRRVLETGEPHVARAVPTRARGTEHWFDVSYERLEPDAVVAIAVDVTSAVRSRRGMSAALVGVWEIDLEDARIILDEDAGALVGIPAGEHALAALYAKMAEDDRVRVRARIESGEFGVRQGDADHFRVLRDNGSHRWLNARGRFATVDGRPVRWSGTIADITGSKAPELEREKEHAALAHSRSRLQAQLAQAPMAISIVTPPDFVYVLANPLYEEAVGRTGITGKSIRAAFPELPADGAVTRMLEQVYRTGEPFVAEEFLVPLQRGGQLEDVYFKFSCSPVRDEEGVVTEIMTVLVEVTAQVAARREIEQLNADLRVADQRKDEFLAMLAHELRNPLAAISGALSLLEEPGQDAERAAYCRATARRQTDNLVRLVDDMLDVARITRGQVELRRVPVDLATIVRHAMDVVGPPIAARRHEVSVELPREGTPVVADPARVEQIVVNLCMNAAKYTEPGGRITVHLERDGREAVLRVRDTGRGISREMHEAVFELFTQVTPPIDRTTGGLGLGLTLVRRLTEMHGGTVRVESEGEGKGSEFIVRLPIADVSAPRVDASAPVAVGAAQRRVLLVEDEEDVRDMMSALLERKGHAVVASDNGDDAVARFSEGAFDVALVDVGLPTIDGYEVARRIRALPGGATAHLVALTGYGGEGIAARAADAGFDEHVTKPVQIAQLAQLLARGRQA